MEGKAGGSIRPDASNRFFKALLFGGLNRVLLRWLVLERDTKIDKMSETEEVICLLERAVSSKSHKPRP
jgi:hypothetical protein